MLTPKSVQERLYPPQKKAAAGKIARETAQILGNATIISQSAKSCSACEIADERPKPTDLILVIHGIGQKLSERVESFHFTHAINAFRRQVNVELDSDNIAPWLRQDLGTVMVLPINWRSTLKLEEGGGLEPDTTPEVGDPTKNRFDLKDITPESIPAVRGLISDVMLDIPYYLSHHKPKMVEAVIHEANRVYRLWCINNPGFQENGRYMFPDPTPPVRYRKWSIACVWGAKKDFTSYMLVDKDMLTPNC